MPDFDSVTALERLQVYTSLSGYSLPPYMWNPPLSQWKETLQKAQRTPRISVQQERCKGDSNNPKQKIFCFVQVRTCGKSASETTALCKTSAHRSAEIASPPEREAFAAAAVPFWAAGNLRAAFPPPRLNLERREKTEPWPFCWLLAFQYTNYSLSEKQSCMSRTQNSCSWQTTASSPWHSRLPPTY